MSLTSGLQQLIHRERWSWKRNRKLVLGLLAITAISLVLTATQLYSQFDRHIEEWIPKGKGETVFRRHSERCRLRKILGNDITSYSRMAEYLDCSRIIYNRVPKCGSRTVIVTMKALAKQHHFHLYSEARGPSSFLTRQNLTDLVQHISNLDEPLIYTRHVHFLDMESHGYVQPLYINVIRDPIERLISHYYFNLFGSSSKPKGNNNTVLSLDECLEKQISKPGTGCLFLKKVVLQYFCGHSSYCKNRTQSELLARAKETVRRNYIVVGHVERLSYFFEVLEVLLPHFFSNASKTLKSVETSSKKMFQTVKKYDIKPSTRARLLEVMAAEYDFFNFVKQRFYNQLIKVRLIKSQPAMQKLFTSVAKTNMPVASEKFNEFVPQ